MSIVTNATILSQALSLLREAKTEVCLTSPWITGGELRNVLEAIPRDVAVRVIFRIEKPGDLQVTSAEALRLLRLRPATTIRYSPKLHAKTILVDAEHGIISSSNITQAGMSEWGNQEMGVLVRGIDASGAQAFFEEFWQDSRPLPADCVGFLLNPTAAQRLTLVGLDPTLSIETLVRVELGTTWLLGRVNFVRRWNRGFFADPYGSDVQMLTRPGQSLMRPALELLPFVESPVADWNFAGVKALAEESKFGDVLIVEVSVEAHVENGVLRAPLTAPPVAAEVLRAATEHLSPLLTRKGCIEVGKLIAQPVPVALDLGRIASQHLAVMGMTGSGKSHFMKVFLGKLGSWTGDVFVFDPHAEYSIDGFEKLHPPGELLYFAEEDLVRDYVKTVLGDDIKANSNDGKAKLAAIADAWRSTDDEAWRFPRKLLLALKEKNFDVPEEDFAAAKLFEEWYPKFETALTDGGRYVIGLQAQDNSSMRTELMGLMLGRLYEVAKSSSTKNDSRARPRLIVLEEAHSVIPEKSEASDVSGGKDNSALREASRIAAEGRKFNLGLVVVTQRPAKVSKSVLSQCNTQVLFRLKNSNDLSAVAGSVEGASKEVLGRLPVLQTGECFISGLAVPFSLLCRINDLPA